MVKLFSVVGIYASKTDPLLIGSISYTVEARSLDEAIGRVWTDYPTKFPDSEIKSLLGSDITQVAVLFARASGVPYIPVKATVQ